MESLLQDLRYCVRLWLRKHGFSLIAFIALTHCVGVMAASFSAVAQESPIDQALARQYFNEAQTLCQRDNGRIWGVSLCGPLLFADPKTRAVAANQSDREGQLKNSDGVFAGRLPEKVNAAYTAVEWAGVKWTMVIWPLPEDKYERGRLYAHESWHRIQPEIGFPSAGPANAHLDALEGRIWLRLEWRALREALTHSGAQRRRAIDDALTFRLYRRSLFPEAAAEERALEMHEGLAEYTGVKLSGHPDPKAFAVKLIEQVEANETYVRSFAYASGPAYGLLLDEAGLNWRKGLKPADDFGRLLAPSFSLQPGAMAKKRAEQAAQRYDGVALRAAETERDSQRRKQAAQLRARFVEGPVLQIPLRQMKMQFDPNHVQPLAGHGTVYPEIRIVDVWGILTVSKGALMSSTFDRVTVSVPTGLGAKPITGDGWTLELKEGWVLTPSERKGDYVLKPKE